MRYYTEPYRTSKVVVTFNQPTTALEFFNELKDRRGVFELSVLGPKVQYWCLTREEGVGLCVDFEKRWIERHQATAQLISPPAAVDEKVAEEPAPKITKKSAAKKKVEPVLEEDNRDDE